jgi:hypothetical protein
MRESGRRADPLPFRANLEEYEQEAKALFDASKSGEEDAEWRFKWECPRFRGKSVTDVRGATLDLSASGRDRSATTLVRSVDGRTLASYFIG